ncbi:archaellin/type IV pilin N-terminal domain-containing protein [Halovenus salina]|uniref:Flagellin n=1 Tax=Halovenus salina TaxID=1510225 RepID=A0ABD5VXY6_9EURY|nr:archaellin/type IV pilin N-terminal domain-containing protein [Halovenus salina]
MIQNLFNTDESTESRRAQVGIGTLIVFIAMVLVAAIAAGVLINTAGFLQTQAQDTGTESTSQVADNLNVITEVGNVSSNDEINQLRLGVQPSAGADDINLAQVTLQYVSDNEFANIVVGNATGKSADVEQATGDNDPDEIRVEAYNSTNSQFDDPRASGDERFNISVVTAENEDDVVMTDGADRYELVLPLTAAAEPGDITDATGTALSANTAFNGDLAPLAEGADTEITITTEVGSQTVAFLQVPDSLSGDDPGTTVNL